MATETDILESVSSKILEAVKEKTTMELEKITEHPSIMCTDATLTEEKGERKENALLSELLEEKVTELPSDKVKQLESRPNPLLETSSHVAETVNTQLETDTDNTVARGVGTDESETFLQPLSVPVVTTDENRDVPESCEATITKDQEERKTNETESFKEGKPNDDEKVEVVAAKEASENEHQPSNRDHTKESQIEVEGRGSEVSKDVEEAISAQTEGSIVNVLGLTKGSGKDIEEVRKISHNDETSNTEKEENQDGEGKEPEFIKTTESIEEDTEEIRPSVETEEKTEQQELLDGVTTDVSISTQKESQEKITENEGKKEEEVTESDDCQKKKSDSSEKVESEEGVELFNSSSIKLNEKAIEILSKNEYQEKEQELNVSKKGQGEDGVTCSEDVASEEELHGKNHYGEGKEPEFVKSTESIEEDNEEIRSSVETKEKVEQQELLHAITTDVSITKQTESQEETTENEEKKEEATESDDGPKEKSDSPSVKEACEETGPEKAEYEERVEPSDISNITLKEKEIETLSKGEDQEKEQELNMSEKGQGEDDVACSQPQDEASEEELQGKTHDGEGKVPKFVKTRESIEDDTEEIRSGETKEKLEHQGLLTAIATDASISTQTDSQEETTQNEEKNMEEAIESDDVWKEKSDSPLVKEVSEETGSEKAEYEEGVELSDSSGIKLNDKAIELLNKEKDQENEQEVNMSEKGQGEDNIARSQPKDAASEDLLQGKNNNEGQGPEIVKTRESVEEDTEEIRSVETKEKEQEGLPRAITTDVSISTQTACQEETTHNEAHNEEETIELDDSRKEKSDGPSFKEVCEETSSEKVESEEGVELSDNSSIKLNEKAIEILTKDEDQEKEQELNMSEKGQGEDDVTCSHDADSEEELQRKNHNGEVKVPEIVKTRESIEEDTEEIRSVETKEKVEQEGLLHTITTDVSFSTQTESQEETIETEEKNEEEAIESDDVRIEKSDSHSVKEVCEETSSEKVESEEGVELSDNSSIKLNEKAIEILTKDEDQEKKQKLNKSDKSQGEDDVIYSQDVVSEKELQEKNHNWEGKEPGFVKTRESIEEDSEEIRSSVEAKENVEQEGLLHSTTTNVSISTQTESKEEIAENEEKNEEIVQNDDGQEEKSHSHTVKEVREETSLEKAESEEGFKHSDSASTKLNEKETSILGKDEDQEKEQELTMSEKGQGEDDITCSQDVASEEELQGKNHNSEDKETELVKTRESIEEDTEEIRPSVETEEKTEHVIATDVSISTQTASQEETTKNEEEAVESEDDQKEKSSNPSVKEVCEETGLVTADFEERVKLSESSTPSMTVNEKEIAILSKDEDQEKEQVFNVSEKNHGEDDVTSLLNAPRDDIKETTTGQDATTVVYFEEQGLIERPEEILKEDTEDKSIDAQEASEQCENGAEDKGEQKPKKESVDIAVRSSSEVEQEVEGKITEDEADGGNKKEEAKISETQFVDKDFDVAYPVEETETGDTKDELKPKDYDPQDDKGSSEGSDVLLSRSIKTEAVHGSETGELETQVEQEMQEKTRGHKFEDSESESPTTTTQEILEAVGENATELEKITEQDFQESQSEANKEIEAKLEADAESENLPIEDLESVSVVQTPGVVPTSEDSSPDGLENANDNGSEEEKCIPDGRTREIEIPILKHELVEEQNGGLHEVSMEKSKDLKETTVEPQEDAMPSSLETPTQDDSNLGKSEAESEKLPIEDLESVSDVQIPGVPMSEDTYIKEECLISATETSIDKDGLDEDNGTLTKEISSDKKIEWSTETEQVTEHPSIMCVDATLTEETSDSDPIPVGNSEVTEARVHSQIGQEDLQIAEDISCESNASSTVGSVKMDMNVGNEKSVEIIGEENNDSVDEAPKEARIPALEDTTSLEPQVDLSYTESTDSPSESEKLPIKTLESVCDAQSPEVVANSEDSKVKETAEYTDENKEEHGTIANEVSSAEEKEQTTNSKQVAEHPSIFYSDADFIEEVSEQIEKYDGRVNRQQEIGRSSEHENIASEGRSVEDPRQDLVVDETISEGCAQETKEENAKQAPMNSDEVKSDATTETKALTEENFESFAKLKPASGSTIEEQSSDTPPQPEKSGDAFGNSIKYETLESRLEHKSDKDSIDVERDIKEVVTLTPENQTNSTQDCDVRVKDVILTEEISHSDPIPVGNLEVTEVRADSQTGLEGLQAEEDLNCELKASSTIEASETDVKEGFEQHVTIAGEVKNDGVNEPLEERISVVEEATTLELPVNVSNIEFSNSMSESEKSPIIATHRDEGNVDEEHETIANETASEGKSEEKAHNEQVVEQPSMVCLDDEEEIEISSGHENTTLTKRDEDTNTEAKALTKKNLEPYGELKPTSESMIEDQVNETMPQPEQSGASENNVKYQTLESKLEHMGEKDLLKPENQINSTQDHYETVKNVILTEEIQVSEEDSCPTEVEKTSASNQKELASEIPYSEPPFGNTEVTKMREKSHIELENIPAAEDLSLLSKASSIIGVSKLETNKGAVQTVTIAGEAGDDRVDEAPNDEGIPALEDTKSLEPQVDLTETESTVSPSDGLDIMKLREGMPLSTQETIEEKGELVSHLTDKEILSEGAVKNEKEAPNLEFEKKEKDDELISEIQTPEGILKTEVKEEHLEATTDTDKTRGLSSEQLLDELEDINTKEDIEITARGEEKAIEESYQDAEAGVTLHESLSQKEEKLVSMVPHEELTTPVDKDQANELVLETDKPKVDNSSISNKDQDLELIEEKFKKTFSENRRSKEEEQRKCGAENKETESGNEAVEDVTVNEVAVEVEMVEASISIKDNTSEEASCMQNQLASATDEVSQIKRFPSSPYEILETKGSIDATEDLELTAKNLNLEDKNFTVIKDPNEDMKQNTENTVDIVTSEFEKSEKMVTKENKIKTDADEEKETLDEPGADGTSTAKSNSMAQDIEVIAEESRGHGDMQKLEEEKTTEVLEITSEGAEIVPESREIPASLAENLQEASREMLPEKHGLEDNTSLADNDKKIEDSLNLPSVESEVDIIFKEAPVTEVQNHEKGLDYTTKARSDDTTNNAERPEIEQKHLNAKEATLESISQENQNEQKKEADENIESEISSEKVNYPKDNLKEQEYSGERTYQDLEAAKEPLQTEELSDKVEKADPIDIQEETMAKDNLHEDKTGERTNIKEATVELHHKEKGDETNHEGTSTEVATPIEDVNSSGIEEMDKTAEVYEAEKEIVREEVHLEPTGDRSKITEEVSLMKEEPQNLPSTKERSMEFDAPVTHGTSATEGLEISQKYVTDDLTKVNEVQSEIQKHEDLARTVDEQLPNKSHQNESTESKLSARNIDASDEQGKTTANSLNAEAEDLKATKASGPKPLCSSEVFKEEEKMSDGKGMSETAEPTKSLFTDILHESAKGTSQVAENLIEEKEPVQKKDRQVVKEETGDSGVKTYEENEEEDNEDNQKMGSYSDAPVMVEASTDMEVKVHKKSHNILSGVGSKVKHSIAKVKKAITGKSSHPKPPSPKQKDDVIT